MTRRSPGVWRAVRQARWAGSAEFATATSGPLSTIAIDVISPGLRESFVQAFGRHHVRIVAEARPRDLAGLLRRAHEPLLNEPAGNVGNAGLPSPSLGAEQLCEIIGERDRRTPHTRILAYTWQREQVDGLASSVPRVKPDRLGGRLCRRKEWTRLAGFGFAPA